MFNFFFSLFELKKIVGENLLRSNKNISFDIVNKPKMENTVTLPDSAEHQPIFADTTTSTDTATASSTANNNSNSNSTNREVKRYKVRSKTEDSVLAHSSAAVNTESNENANEAADNNGEVVIMSIQERLVFSFFLIFTNS